MKKGIFKVGFLTTLILILAVSCTSPTEETTAKMPVVNNKQKVANSSALPDVYEVDDIPAYIGALHNASIYAFVDYVQEYNLSPYEVGGLTEAMIDTFARDYIEANLLPILENFEPTTEVSTIILDALEDEIMFACDSVNGVDEINYEIQERVDYLYEVFAIDGDGVLVYETIKEIAMATNVLWGRDWNYSYEYFINPDPSYETNKENSGETENEDEKERKEKEEQKELKKADIQGAVDGAIDGALWGSQYGWITGAWGAVGGAALGATIASIKEWVHQEMEKAALYMDVDYVVPNSYLYDYLLMLQQATPDKYYDLFGNKFDDILF